MKASYKILILLAVCAVIGAQIWYSTTRAKPAVAERAAQAEPEPEKPIRPQPAAVTTVILSGADGANPVWLARTGSGWTIETLYGVPANTAAVDKLLAALLAEAEVVDNPSATGAEPEGGVLVSLGVDGGEATPYMLLGLRPDNSYDSVYARMLDTDEVVLIQGDVRGDIGLWKNTPGLLPQNEPWLETKVFAFDPDAVSSLTVEYPDHRLEFSRTESGDWDYAGIMPGGVWHHDGLIAWLKDVAEFRITEVGDPSIKKIYGLDAPTHKLEIRLADGTVKSIAAAPNRMGDGMWIELSDIPEQVFFLPGWRFQFYFQRINDLFPLASPKYVADAIRFIDIRRGGESVKLTRRNNEWSAVATRYPLRKDRIVRLATVLASWRPDDFAAPGARQARPVFGGPLVEVTLEDGTVHQYRLGGRHPVFPWRYVLVDGKTMLSTADADAMSIFPDFAEIMDLGMVFGDLMPEQVTRLELSSMDHAEPLVSAGLTATGEWEVATEAGRSIMGQGEVDGLVFAPFSWKVAGFYRVADSEKPEDMLLLEISGGGAERRIVILSPQGRDIPYVNENDQTFLVDRTAFFTWLGTLRGINLRIEKEVEEQQKIEAEQAIRALEEAEAEAIAQALEEEERAKAAEALKPPEPEQSEQPEQPELETEQPDVDAFEEAPEPLVEEIPAPEEKSEQPETEPEEEIETPEPETSDNEVIEEPQTENPETAPQDEPVEQVEDIPLLYDSISDELQAQEETPQIEENAVGDEPAA